MHGMYVRPSESSDVALSRVGYWSRDEMVKMDQAATLRMLRFHPNRASPQLVAALAKAKQLIPQSVPYISTPLPDGWLKEIIAALPPSSGDGTTTAEIDRLQIGTAQAIRKTLAAQRGLTINDLDCASRNHGVVLVRQEAMYLVARECPSLSYPRIGRMFGGKDHTCVMKGIRQHADRNGLPRVRERQAG